MRPSRIPLPARLRSTPVTRLRHYYARSDSCPTGSSALTSMNTVLLSGRSPCVLCHAIITIPSPPTLRPPRQLSHATPHPPWSRHSTERFRLSTAGSSSTSGRIEFVILRTGDSPPVALHPASRRRSDRWLQARRAHGLERTHTSLSWHHCRRTAGCRLWRHGRSESGPKRKTP